MPKVEIDSKSGFCFGVVNAIKKAEQELNERESLYCLGDIVHNNNEVERLRDKGLISINHTSFCELKDTKVLLRAHGEPPETYKIANNNNITIIDATCPVVLQLQKQIKEAFNSIDTDNTSIVIYGKRGHAEVNGLVGQTNGKAIVVEGVEDFTLIDFNKNILLYSQTTKSVEGFKVIAQEIKGQLNPDKSLQFHDTICRQVANRIPNIRRFAKEHDTILFVSGAKSSNGKELFKECLKINPKSYLISDINTLDTTLIEGADSIGICGATSTPKWLMEELMELVMRVIK